MSYLDINVIEHKLRELPDEALVRECFDSACAAARKNFQIHKEVMPMFIIVCLDGPSHCPAELVIPTPWLSEDEKYEYFSFIKKMAIDTRAVAVMHVSECWFAAVDAPPDFDPKKHDLRPASEHPNRKEVVQITCVSSLLRPRNHSRFAYIHRPRGQKPRLGPWEGEDKSFGFIGNLFDLLPVLGN